MPIVAISASNDPDLILRSLRQGASEFLFQPFTVEQVGTALDRLARIKLDANLSISETGHRLLRYARQGSHCGAHLLWRVTWPHPLHKLNFGGENPRWPIWIRPAGRSPSL